MHRSRSAPEFTPASLIVPPYLLPFFLFLSGFGAFLALTLFALSTGRTIYALVLVSGLLFPFGFLFLVSTLLIFPLFLDYPSPCFLSSASGSLVCPSFVIVLTLLSSALALLLVAFALAGFGL